MARDIRSLSTGGRLTYGIGCIAIGCYPIALALGYVQADGEPLSPPWVIAGAGIAFVIAGFMILLAHHSTANDLLAGILLLIFGIMGVWVSLFSSDEGFSGGPPLLSDETNILLARWFFGLGSLVSFAMCGYAFRRAASGSKAAQPDTER